MLKEVLVTCLLGSLGAQGMNVKPLYHHPVYNVPVYPYHGYAVAAAKQAPQTKVTSYAKVSNHGTHFWQAFCWESDRKIAELFSYFDLDHNGIVSFPELNSASLCNVLEAEDEHCNWIHDTHLGDEIVQWSEYDGQDQYMKREVVEHVLELFHHYDHNDDNLLNMDEFWEFGNGLYDTWNFAHYATRDITHIDEEEEDFDIITQDEWDCIQTVEEDGLEYPQCNPSPANGQLLIEELVGNDDHDDHLTLWEFFAVKAHLLKQAKASVHWYEYAATCRRTADQEISEA